jgi:hypothetical protein
MTFAEKCKEADLSALQSKKALAAFFEKFGIRSTTKDHNSLQEKAAALTWAYHHQEYSDEWPTTLNKEEFLYLQRALPHIDRVAKPGETPTDTLLRILGGVSLDQDSSGQQSATGANKRPRVATDGWDRPPAQPEGQEPSRSSSSSSTHDVGGVHHLPQSASAEQENTDVFFQAVPRLPPAASVSHNERRSVDDDLLRRIPEENRIFLFSSRTPKDKPEMVHRYSLTTSLPHVDLARHTGISLAFAARFKRFGLRLPPPQYDTARHLWPSALQYFKSSQELPASLFAQLQYLVEDFFEARLAVINSMFGLAIPELVTGVRRQAKEVPTICRIIMENIINRPLHTSPAEMHLLPAAANSDYYFLFAPFFEEHYGFAAAVALTSAVSNLSAALGSSPRLTGTVAACAPTPPTSAAGTFRIGAFVGLPASPDIVGPALSVWSSSLPCNRCRGPHCSWECPARYFQTKGEPCPGFDERGAKIPSAWSNGEITPATKAAWRDYITRHNLQQAQSCPRIVNFS